ncbi:MAG: hypothetical protein BZY88_06080 [SAR202 cluster bacterium Io17-Chloro-G9]|nr:MAG: hypothetical protein BZY88_06080 [SAR202 cluster bacterium Io17-Chloro-G9]
MDPALIGAIAGAVAAGTALLTFLITVVFRRKDRDSPADGDSTIQGDVRNANIASTVSGGVGIAGDQTEVTGQVAGRDLSITYENFSPLTISTALHQIPRPSDDFTGRQAELKELLEKIQQGGVAISGLRGLGGIGKTALALVLAHRLAPEYPDAQFYLDLKGTSPEPLSPADAMAHVIRSYNREVSLPENENELRALYNSMLYSQRAIVLMDNAADADQVRNPIPPEGCILLVTSRRRFDLPGLFAMDLDTLAPGEARDLLVMICPRIGGHADRIAELCGYLPMAMELAGRALNQRVDFSPAQYLRRLVEAQQRFPEVDASLSLSYDLLTQELQRSWRTLAVFPGLFVMPAAAAVWEVDSDAAQDNLGDLLGYSLVEWDPGNQRYHLHDLGRLNADGQLTEEERTTAQRRHATHFRDVLMIAQRWYIQGDRRMMDGLALFDLEWGNIQAGQAWAQAHSEVVDEATGLCSDYPGAADLLGLRLHQRDQVRWLEAALTAARRLGDRSAEGRHLGNLGIAFRELGDTRRAIQHHELALANSQASGDRRAEGDDLGGLGSAHLDLGDTRRAIEFYEQALAISRELSDRKAEGQDLGNLGSAYNRLGEHQSAIEYLERSLDICRELGYRRGEGAVLGNLGNAYAGLGQARRGLEFHEQALAISRELGDRRAESHNLWNMAIALLRLGERDQAIEQAEVALQMMVEVEDPNVESVRETMDQWRGER